MYGDLSVRENLRYFAQMLAADAARIKQVLVEQGAWSQYLEVGIGPDAEIFTKTQPMASVGHGALIGLHPKSVWNNPEPEIVLAVNSRGRIQGATTYDGFAPPKWARRWPAEWIWRTRRS